MQLLHPTGHGMWCITRMRLDVSVNMLSYQALKNGRITVFGGDQTSQISI